MGKVLFSINIIDSFKNQVHDYFYQVKREVEKAESALSFCEGEINSQIEKAERMRSDAYSDYDLADIISDRNRSTISSLKSELSSLGTGEENASQRKAVQAKISGAEKYNNILDGIKNNIRSLIDKIDREVDELETCKARMEIAYHDLRSQGEVFFNVLGKIDFKIERAKAYAKEIVIALSFFDPEIRYPESVVVDIDDSSIIGEYYYGLDSAYNGCSENRKKVVSAAYNFKSQLTDETAETAAQAISSISAVSEVFENYLSNAKAAFKKAANYLASYESLAN